MDKFAAIDLGTNTFHLLIVSFDKDGKIVEQYRDRKYIHLAQEGIKRIGEDAFRRAVTCAEEFAEILREHQVQNVKFIGTAALRTASNGIDLVDEIERITGYNVKIIDGITEARLILEGIKLSIPEIQSGNHLIMDIGGGSVEFVIIKDGHLFWSSSYPLGIAILKRKFHKTDPIAEHEIQKLEKYLERHLGKLIYISQQFQFDSLIGASGSFEVLQAKNNAEKGNSFEVCLDHFNLMNDSVIYQNMEERMNRSDIPNERAELIVVAFLLMEFVIRKVSIRKFFVSDYALKEGALSLLYTKTESQFNL